MAIQEKQIERLIYLIRGHRVMLDFDLADAYGVPTKQLNQAVRRNPDRFPSDFMFQLSLREVEAMRSQSVTASSRNIRFLPFAFTEHGALMLASVLNSPTAVQASVLVVRAFVQLRAFLAKNRKVVHKLQELESRLNSHDKAIQSLIAAIRQLMEPPMSPRPKIGFASKEGDAVTKRDRIKVRSRGG